MAAAVGCVTPLPAAAADHRRHGARRPAALVLCPPKLVPMDPEHEQEAVYALTELFLQLLALDAEQSAKP